MDLNGNGNGVNHNSINSTEENSSKSTRRNTLSQCCAISVAQLMMLTYGASVGFSTILLPELRKSDAEIKVSEDELTWIVSMNFFAIPLSSLSSGPITGILGRKPMMVISSVMGIIAWVLIRWSGSQWWMLLFGYALLGLAGGTVESPGRVYITEVCEPRIRGIMSASLSASMMLGIFLPILVGTYIYWRTLALINLAFPIVAFAVSLALPESPIWLASKGRTEQAEKALCWLRGWTSSINVKREFDSILKATSSSAPGGSNAAHQSIGEVYFRREVVMPFLLLTVSFFVSSFNSCVVIRTYTVVLFQNLGSPIDEYTSAILCNGLQVISALLLMAFIGRLGKKIPTLASLVISGACVLFVAIYQLLRERDVIVVENTGYTWIPMVMLLIVMFFSSSGIANTPWYMIGEVFPVNARSITVGLIASMGNISAALANKTFLSMEEAFTLPGVFFFFMAVNFFGFVLVYRYWPETEGKTLTEIEEFFRRKPRKERDLEEASRRFAF